MVTVVLKRIGVLSMAKFQAILMALMGLVVTLFFVVVAFLGGAVLGGSFDLGVMLGGLGTLVLIGTPVIFGLYGFITGAIGALLYNLVSKLVGGLKMEFEELE